MEIEAGQTCLDATWSRSKFEERAQSTD